MSLRGLILCAFAAAIALPEGGRDARAETLMRLRLRAPSDGDEALAESLSGRGFDVVPPRSDGDGVEVVASAAEADALRQSGYAFVVIGRGAPAAADPALRKYPTLAEVTARMQRIAVTSPEIARFVDVTEEYDAPATFEGRHLYALRISGDASRQGDEPAVLVMAGLHPRELVNPLIALDVAERLVLGYGSDPDITAVVDANDVWIAPIWNPDGYVYVIDSDNLWRKNRQPFEDGVGVDLNRNFPFGWDSDCAGADSATSRFYKGPSAASERETRAMIALTEAVRFAKVLEFHSPGREVVWGSPCSTFPLDTFVHDTAVELSRALGYGGRTRLSSADGEHHQWQLARTGTLSFLVETATVWQPTYEAALDEVDRVWPGVLWLLRYPISISGRVTPTPGEGTVALPLDEAPVAEDWGCGCRGSSPRRSALGLLLVFGIAWLSVRRRSR